MSNITGTKRNGMHRKIKIVQRGDGNKIVRMSVNRRTRVRVKKS